MMRIGVHVHIMGRKIGHTGIQHLLSVFSDSKSEWECDNSES